MSANPLFQAALPGFLTDDVPCILLSFDTTHGVRGIHDTNGPNPHDRSGRSNKSKAWLDMLVCLSKRTSPHNSSFNSSVSLQVVKRSVLSFPATHQLSSNVPKDLGNGERLLE